MKPPAGYEICKRNDENKCGNWVHPGEIIKICWTCHSAVIDINKLPDKDRIDVERRVIAYPDWNKKYNLPIVFSRFQLIMKDISSIQNKGE